MTAISASQDRGQSRVRKAISYFNTKTEIWIARSAVFVVVDPFTGKLRRENYYGYGTTRAEAENDLARQFPNATLKIRALRLLMGIPQ